MAITVSGLTVHTQTGAGTWKDYGGGGGSSSNTDVFLSSTGSRARKVSNGTKGFAFDLGSGGTDLSSTVIAVRWATLAGVGALNTRALGGVSVRLEDTSGTTGDYYVDGNDTYGGGWQFSAVSTTRSASSGTPTLTAIRYIGIVWDETASVGGGDPNCYIDEILSWGNAGLTVSGNSTDLIPDLQAWDDANKYGLIETRSGITYSATPIILSPDATGFAAVGDTLVFEDPSYYDGTNISSTLNEIGLSSSSANAIDLERFTCIADTRAEINGSAVARSYDFGSASSLTYATGVLRGFDATTNPMQIGGSGSSYTGVSWEACGQITETGAVVRDSFVRSPADAAGGLIWTATSDFENVLFESDGTGHGIEVSITGTLAWQDLNFSGFGADDTANAAVDNTSGGSVTINVSGGNSPTVDPTSTTTVNNPVNFELTGLISGSRVSIVRDSDLTILAETLSSPGSTFLYQYNYTTDTDVAVRIITAAQQFIEIPITLSNTDRSIPISQRFDRVYANP